MSFFLHRRISIKLIAFIFAFLASVIPSTAICYLPDGSKDCCSKQCPGSNMCCYLNRTDGYDDDVCTRGACLSRYWPGEYFVIACTSSDWEESGCSPLWKACGQDPSRYTRVSICPDNSYCCGQGNTTCCDDASGIYLNEDGTEIIEGPRQPHYLSTSFSSQLPTVSPRSSSTSMAIASTTTPSTVQQTGAANDDPKTGDKNKGGLTSEAKIALGCGIGLGVPSLLVAIATWLK